MPPLFDDRDREAAKTLIGLALAEDLDGQGDLTCAALIPPTMQGRVNVVVRTSGVVAGLPVAELVFAQLDPAVRWQAHLQDGAQVAAGTVAASVQGPLRSLLTGERTALNFLTHLSGVATLTRRFVDAVANATPASKRPVILDTRKTLPGWRRLEKYAVRAGGGVNHRMGLSDGCLIKDNHLAAWRSQQTHPSIAAAIDATRQALAFNPSRWTNSAISPRTASVSPTDAVGGLSARRIPIEVEVDTSAQLVDALAGRPDIVLLDNMDLSTLRECVALRDRNAPGVLLEASGGVTLDNVAQIAATGIDSISVGALTHSAPALDLAFDWQDSVNR